MKSLWIGVVVVLTSGACSTGPDSALPASGADTGTDTDTDAGGAIPDINPEPLVCGCAMEGEVCDVELNCGTVELWAVDGVDPAQQEEYNLVTLDCFFSGLADRSSVGFRYEDRNGNASWTWWIDVYRGGRGLSGGSSWDLGCTDWEPTELRRGVASAIAICAGRTTAADQVSCIRDAAEQAPLVEVCSELDYCGGTSSG